MKFHNHNGLLDFLVSFVAHMNHIDHEISQDALQDFLSCLPAIEDKIQTDEDLLSFLLPVFSKSIETRDMFIREYYYFLNGIVSDDPENEISSRIQELKKTLSQAQERQKKLKQYKKQLESMERDLARSKESFYFPDKEKIKTSYDKAVLT